MSNRRETKQTRPKGFYKVTGASKTVASGRRGGREAQPYLRYGEHRRPPLQRAAGLRAPPPQGVRHDYDRRIQPPALGFRVSAAAAPAVAPCAALSGPVRRGTGTR